MDLTNLLQSIGLTPTESKVYLEALNYNDLNAGELADLVSLKRPTVYHALETLEEKGLIRKIVHSKIIRYKAEPLEQLKILLEKKQADFVFLEKQVDKAVLKFPQNKTELNIPKIEFFKGHAGIEALAEKTFLENKSKVLYTIIPSYEMTVSTFSERYIKYYAEEKKKRGVVTKSVWGNLPDDKYFHSHQEFFREVRLAPENIKDKYRSMIFIWDKKVAVISLLPELFGFLVTGFDYSETMKMIWETIWSVSRKIKNV